MLENKEVNWDYDHIYANKLFVYPLLAISVTLLFGLLLTGKAADASLILMSTAFSVISFFISIVITFKNFGTKEQERGWKGWLLLLPFLLGLLSLGTALFLLIKTYSPMVAWVFFISTVFYLPYAMILTKEEDTPMFVKRRKD